MTKRILVLGGDKVVRNIIVAADDFEPDGVLYFESAGHGIGSIYDPESGEFSFPPEPPPHVPQIISNRQFFQQCAISGIITEQEAIDMLATGALPQAMEAVIESLPAAERFNARALLVGAREFDRHHPLTLLFAAHLGYSEGQIDELWINASQL